MYEELDSFTRVSTWATTHWLDDVRFYEALNGIVRNKEFNAYQLEEYLRTKYRERFPSNSPENKEREDSVCEAYRSHAEVIRSYLRALGETQE